MKFNQHFLLKRIQLYLYLVNTKDTNDFSKLLYPENRWTWILTNFASNCVGSTRSVSSVHSLSSSSQFRNNTLTRHLVGSGLKSCRSRRETGSWIVTGLKNWTTSKHLIRRIGPRNTPSSLNSSFGTSCTCTISKRNHQQLISCILLDLKIDAGSP